MRMDSLQNRFIYFDWISFFLTMLITGIGLLFVWSATYTVDHPFSLFFKKQLAGIILGLCVYLACAYTDYRWLMRTSYFGYFIIIPLLMFTLVKGSIGMGGQRWINLFFFKFQPSEVAKFLFPGFLSYYFFTHPYVNKTSWKTFLPILFTLAISFVLILKQPDLGTACTVLFSGLTLLWLAGLSNRFFLCGAILVTLAAPGIWHVLKPYQRNRIFVFLGYGETRKERYQIEQATIAIGSGGITGKGLLHGTQNKFQFLPESRTDFIFAVICEEWGLLGALLVLMLYAALFIRIMTRIYQISASYIQLLIAGLAMHVILSAIINICMVTGLMPIVGIPLPFMSYGLSNLVISFASLGWIQGICMQHKKMV